MILLTCIFAATLIGLAAIGLHLARRVARPRRIAALAVTVAAQVSIAIVFAVALNRVWAGQQARDQQIREARDQHLERIHTLLRSESDALRELADSLRSGRYFTQVANDSRQAVWRDEALTADIEHHFPDYFGEREQLIRTILQYDDTLGRLRQRVSESLHLSDWTDPYAIELVSALVKKCGGGYVPRTVPEESSARHPEREIHARAALQAYDQYRCAPPLAAGARRLLDWADDLADQAVQLSEEARRDAEEVVLHGECTYAPAEPR